MKKLSKFVDTRIGFFTLLVVLFWFKTLFAYFTDFNLGASNIFQYIILIFNPLATTALIYSIAFYFKRARFFYPVIMGLDIANTLLLYLNVIYYREFTDFMTIATMTGYSKVNQGLSGSSLALTNFHDVFYWLDIVVIIVLMLLVSLFVGIIHPNFFAPANLINLFKNVSIRYIIALGISGCLITTGNDLSAGRLAGFAACLACIFAQTEGAAGKFYPNMPTLPTPVVFILVIAICAIVGLCNGLVVSYLKVQPFIATLGMQQVVYGICLVYTGGTPIGSLNKDFTSLASNTILKVPVLIWIALIVAVCFWFLYNKTRHGKYMYAIGGNEAAAEVAGVNVHATKIRIYILASCMFGLAGCLLAAKSGGASVNTAQGYELDAIAASTIGGVSTTGGVGTVPGILVGVLVFELMKVALQFMNVNSSYTYIVQGLVIIVAVAIDIRKYLAKK